MSETEIVRLAEELEAKLEENADDEALQVLGELPAEDAGEVLRHMDDEVSTRLLAQLARPEAAEILEEMVPDSAADLIEELAEGEQTELLKQMEPPEAEVLKKLIEYLPDTAGGLMSPEFVALPQDLTAQQAIEALRRKASEAETIYYAYVIDREGHLSGVLSMRELIMRSPDRPIREIMHRDVLTVPSETDVEEVARLFDRYNFLALPVVDQEDRLLGIVTVDDVIDVMREETTEDMHRMVGVGVDERVFSPWRASLKRRLPWLYVNLLTAFLAATVVGVFQGAIQKYVILAVFMPIIAGMGGNAGSQTVTVLVRGLALGEIQPGEGKRALTKELLLGVLHGAAIGAVVALVAYALSANWGTSPLLGLVVFLAMIFVLVFAGVAGVLIPLGLRFFGLDPALASQIFLTTVTDSAGFLFLLGLATVLLP